MKPTLLPADRVIVAYNIIIAAAWLSAIRSSPGAFAMMGLHLLLATLPWAIARIDPARSIHASVVRYAYPVLLIALFWKELDFIISALHSATNDPRIIALDRWLTGASSHQVFAQAVSWTWFGELMNVIYVLYYPLVFATPVVLAYRGRQEATRDIVFTLTVACCLAFVSYLLFPVNGPKTYMGVVSSAGTDALGYRFVNMLVNMGDSLGTAFPSSHVIGSVTMALLAGRWFSRTFAVLFAFQAVGVMSATVYCQHHYLPDMLAGCLVALCVFFVLAPALKGALKAQPSYTGLRPLRPQDTAPTTTSVR